MVTLHDETNALTSTETHRQAVGERVGLREPAGKADGGRATLTVTCRKIFFIIFAKGGTYKL